MDALRPEQLRGSIPLTAAAATLALMNGEVRRGGQWLDAAWPGRPGRPRRASAGDVHVRLRCSATDWTAAARKAAETAEALLELADAGFLSGSNGRPRPRAHARSAGHLRALARAPVGAASPPRGPSSRAGPSTSRTPEIASLGGLALLELGQGRLRRAAHLARGAADAAESRGLERTPQASMGYAVLALVDYEWNDLDAADDHARMLGEIGGQVGRPDRARRSRPAWTRRSAWRAEMVQIEIGLQRLEGVAGDWSTVDAPALRAACVSLHSRLAAAAGDHVRGPGDPRAGARRVARRLRGPPRSGAPPPRLPGSRTRRWRCSTRTATTSRST